MPREINPWAMYPRKTSTAPLPEALKLEVTTKANELIETVLHLSGILDGYDTIEACWIYIIPVGR